LDSLFAAAHAFVLCADVLGAHIPANGFSTPYILAMALGTAIYGFLGLLFFLLPHQKVRRGALGLSFHSRHLGGQFASCLYVFQSRVVPCALGFAVALFLWYWDRTRDRRTFLQWILLGLLAGLMVDVYFRTASFLFSL